MRGRLMTAVLFVVSLPADAQAARAPVLEGRFDLGVRVVRAQNITDRHVGQRFRRTLRIRRTCKSGSCRFSYALETRSGTFARHPLHRARGGVYVGHERL